MLALPLRQSPVRHRQQRRHLHRLLRRAGHGRLLGGSYSRRAAHLRQPVPAPFLASSEWRRAQRRAAPPAAPCPAGRRHRSLQVSHGPPARTLAERFQAAAPTRRARRAAAGWPLEPRRGPPRSLVLARPRPRLARRLAAAPRRRLVTPRLGPCFDRVHPSRITIAEAGAGGGVGIALLAPRHNAAGRTRSRAART